MGFRVRVRARARASVRLVEGADEASKYVT